MDDVMLNEASKVEITALVDNYSGLFLADTDRGKRMRVLPQGPLWVRRSYPS